ncbi:hypothetical protein FGG08_002752 [Glutinoglossum americanum]|uniref:Uncharacterized protein n=1 Tax=Glutinoglossum americanum TaxID=1670608 RepID=A0A9P8L488_9PEZI|nr:hypothetical protein FGG08_002752 [Glutinoglossum americanum]
MPTFTAKEFLAELYAKDHHQSIWKIDARILQAKMNFAHFTSTGANLPSGGAIVDMCHDLLRRSAAMHTQYAFKGVSHPILFLFFDMGVDPGTAAGAQVSCSTDDNLPRVWAIHSRGTQIGSSAASTSCMGSVTEAFFASATVREKGMYEIARHNLVFSKLARGSRYARIKADGSGYEESSDDGRQDVDNDKDIQMKDA